MAPKRIAVIGAGSSGLTATKCCKEEGFDVVCFEKTGGVGGLWRYHEEDIEDVPSVMKFTVINTSKELSAFSDFPPPKEFPNFMPHHQMLKYFEMYAKRFDLYRHIRYNTEVVSVSKAEDYESTGRWVVRTKDSVNGEESTEIFDGVMVCSGHHVYPRVPRFVGQERFQGKIMHTHSLKTSAPFTDLTVLVIGIGNSGLDAASELSTVARHVYLSTRRGSWVVGKTSQKGLPTDGINNNRFCNMGFWLLGWRTYSNIVEYLINSRYDHSLYGLKPRHKAFSQHPAMNDSLPSRIVNGLVTIKRDVVHFVENGVLFEGDSAVTEIDVVVLATGYNVLFPFLPEDVVNPEENKVFLYKFCFPVGLEHPSLAIIGLAQAFGCVFPIAENQSRWYASLMTGKCCLPSRDSMLKDVIKTQRKLAERFVDSPRHTVEVDYVDYMDEIAELYGAKPNLVKYFMTDQKLFWACLLYPCVAYQYRLQGPHPWNGARDAILSFPERVAYPLTGGKFNIRHELFYPPPLNELLWKPLFMILTCVVVFTLIILLNVLFIR